jgi:hypothetical protein
MLSPCTSLYCQCGNAAQYGVAAHFGHAAHALFKSSAMPLHQLAIDCGPPARTSAQCCRRILPQAATALNTTTPHQSAGLLRGPANRRGPASTTCRHVAAACCQKLLLPSPLTLCSLLHSTAQGPLSPCPLTPSASAERLGSHSLTHCCRYVHATGTCAPRATLTQNK